MLNKHFSRTFTLILVYLKHTHPNKNKNIIVKAIHYLLVLNQKAQFIFCIKIYGTFNKKKFIILLKNVIGC